MIAHWNIPQINLNQRRASPSTILEGHPEIQGRILALSEDRRTARVVWQASPGTIRINPNPAVMDVGYVLKGKAAIRIDGQPEAMIEPGSMVEFPRKEYTLQIFEVFKKISFLYCPEGLTIQAEPV